MGMYLAIIFLLCPTFINCIGQGWTIDQPHRYIILNGEYIELPVEERDTDSPSLLSSLNPMNAFKNFWDSLPSLTFLNRPEEPEAAASENVAATVPSSTFEQAQESASSSIPIPFANYFSNPSSLPTAGIGNFFNGIGLGGFMKKNSHSIKRRSLFGSSVYVSKQPQRRKELSSPEPVKYYYKSLGQGSFIRYEVPVSTPDGMPKGQGQGQGSMKEAIPPSYHPYGSKYNPKHKPQYTKPYYHYVGSEVTTTSRPETTTSSDLEDPFPCPKVGVWKYEDGVCIAVQALPPWGCKPIDLAQSGKLVLCRNKVFY